MVNVQQVTVEVQVLALAHLDRRVGRILSGRTRREGELREDGERGEGGLGQALGGEGGLVGDDLEAVRVGGLDPVWCKRRHDEVMCVCVCDLRSAMYPEVGIGRGIRKGFDGMKAGV